MRFAPLILCAVLFAIAGDAPAAPGEAPPDSDARPAGSVQKIDTTPAAKPEKVAVLKPKAVPVATPMPIANPQRMIPVKKAIVMPPTKAKSGNTTETTQPKPRVTPETKTPPEGETPPESKTTPKELSTPPSKETPEVASTPTPEPPPTPKPRKGKGAPGPTPEATSPVPVKGSSSMPPTPAPAVANKGKGPGTPKSTPPLADGPSFVPATVPATVDPKETASPPSGDPEAQEIARYRALKAQAEEDSAIQKAWQKVQSTTDFDKRRAALQEHYTLLFAKMRKMDDSLKSRIDRMEAAYMRRLDQPGGLLLPATGSEEKK